MFRIEGSDLFCGSKKIGELRADIFDSRGNKIGSCKGQTISDQHGQIIGIVRGNGVYDQSGTRVTTIADIKENLKVQGETSIAALWLLLINKR